VGLKPRIGTAVLTDTNSFRRTLVGLKLLSESLQGPLDVARFRRTLVGLKQLVDDAVEVVGRVSDEPLWG